MKPSRLLKATTSGATLAQIGIAKGYSDRDIANVLRVVATMSDDLNIQLSILGRALVLATQANGIPRHVLDRELDKLWADVQRPGGVLKAN